MPVPSKPVTAELIAEARRLYERTNVPVADICLMLGIGSPTFYRRLAEWKWRKRLERIPVHEPPLAQAAAQQAAPTAAAPDAADDGASVVVRLQRTVEREIAAIEQVLAKFGPNSGHIGDAERAARALASLARTLREIVRLDQPAPAPERPDDDNDDRIPRDLDELRREVSRRLDRLIADAKAACPDARGAD
jgi:hypothetical protein